MNHFSGIYGGYGNELPYDKKVTLQRNPDTYPTQVPVAENHNSNRVQEFDRTIREVSRD